jgi:hypothetical protein
LLAAPIVALLFGAAAGPPAFVFQPATDTFQPTVLDAGGFIDAPTGKHGFLTAKGDRFVFEDGTPARFFGAQIGSVPKAQLDYTVKRMRRQGINITRLHGLEFLNDRNGKTSFDYSDAGWDRLDYLIYKLGENGIYLILDVDYPNIYPFKAGDNISGLPNGGTAQYAEFFNEKVAAIKHQRMRDVFTRVNPYTKKRYADDPTLATVEVMNEDSLFWGNVPEPFRAELEEQFREWLRKKYPGDATFSPGQRIALYRNSDFTEKRLAENPERKLRGQDQLRFFAELEEKYFAASRKVLRDAGIRVPIAGTNWQAHGFPTRIHMLGQSRFDYVDRHGYWDHPQGEGNLRWNIATANFHNLPMIKAVDPKQDTIAYLGIGNLVTEKAWEQVLGRPLTVSEWTTCMPNDYSLEGTPLMTAYGLLQGWDATMQFGYFSPDFRDRLGRGSFDLLSHPAQILQFPAAAIMWHRGDVKEAPVVAESLYDGESAFDWKEDRKPLPLAAALVGKVGYRFVDKPRKPVVQDIAKYWDPEKLVARSITGELTWDARQGVALIDTPRTQAVVGFLSAGPRQLRDVTFKSSTRFGAVYVTAMSGDAPIRSARRLLITAVGPVTSAGREWESAGRMGRLGPFQKLKSPGDGVPLLEAVEGDLRIRVAKPRDFKAWTLDAVGARRGPAPLTVDAGTVVLRLAGEHKAVYYELIVE